MPTRHCEIKVIVEIDWSRSPLHSMKVAEEVANILKTDDVERWAAEVQSIIEECERLRSLERTEVSGPRGYLGRTADARTEAQGAGSECATEECDAQTARDWPLL